MAVTCGAGWAVRRTVAFTSHRGLIGDPCMNSSVLEARGTELAEESGRTRSVGWTPSILWGPRSGVKRRRRHWRLGFESGVGVH